MAIKRVAIAAIAAFASTAIAAPQDTLPTSINDIMDEFDTPAVVVSVSVGISSVGNLFSESPGLISSILSNIPTDFSLGDISIPNISDFSNGPGGDHDHDHSTDESSSASAIKPIAIAAAAALSLTAALF